MPTYEFTCPNGHDFEKFFRTISGGASELPCPVCGLTATRKISAGAGLMFKGSGFYITDYGKDGKKDQNLPRKGANGEGGSSSSSDSGGNGGDSKPSGDAKSSSDPKASGGESKSSDSKQSESKSTPDSKQSESKPAAQKPAESKPSAPKSSSSSE